MKILLGITGSIAAYKTPDLVRKLLEVGHEVKIVMTESAHQFVTKTSLNTVSNQEVYEDLFSENNAHPMEHIELAKWAEIILIAPASANILGKLAHGLADDLLTTIYLASQADLVLAPAMNKLMWEHAAVQENIRILKSRGTRLIGPGCGIQACGDHGLGRMLEPSDIVHELNFLFKPDLYLAGQKILITAGPTQEAIDPVRYISNRSSGKMGYALAKQAKLSGAEVILISGPTNLEAPQGVKTIFVKTADEMFVAVKEHIANKNIFISSAAVGDYKVKDCSSLKIKNNKENLTITLEPNIDILAWVYAQKLNLISVGFAAETHDLERYAKEKLVKKDADFIVANDVSCEDIGFDSDENEIVIFSRSGMMPIQKASKEIIAEKLLREIFK